MGSRVPNPRYIVVYEYTCSGGLLAAKHSHDAVSLMREGWAMLRALATDLAAIPAVRVHVLADHRGIPGPLPGCVLVPIYSAPEERATLGQLARRADWTIVIAPEFDGILHDRCRLVEANGGRLLGPSSDLVALLSDKHATAEHLQRHGVRTPHGFLWRTGDGPPSPLPCPVVIKPNDGAGSQDTCVCADTSQLREILARYQRPARIESFVVGLAASVAFLCGPAGWVALPGCTQRLRVDGAIEYQGGALPLAPALKERANKIAGRAINTLPKPFGYLGVDVLLGDRRDGSHDYVIEINPRLTTSYVGLRAAAHINLAETMLKVADGGRPDLSFGSDAIEFDADGEVRRLGTPNPQPRTLKPSA